ncbi:hypothetical protein P3T76_012615 [Phytophthora citrophthora]|uniref:Uncharacterized protein n=1 Tax=Phytophthora citrophthora TaxID=4793 RepID=A0AAD9G5B5_9STRA|nr:hypothetical protein P3T76_012615 [Phytophthora citrophthora]
MDPSDTSLLTSIRVVCRPQPEIYALDHVVHRVDALIFPSDRLTLSKCVEYNNIRLFTRVLKSLENVKTLCKFKKLQQFRLAMNAVATFGQLWMVKRLYNRHPAALNATTAFLAGKSGNLEMLQWVYEEKKHLMSVNSYAAVYKAFKCSHGELNTVWWLVKTFPNATFDVETRTLGSGEVGGGTGQIQVQ